MLFAHVVAYKVATKNVHLNYVELSYVQIHRVNFFKAEQEKILILKI